MLVTSQATEPADAGHEAGTRHVVARYVSVAQCAPNKLEVPETAYVVVKCEQPHSSN